MLRRIKPAVDSEFINVYLANGGEEDKRIGVT